MFCGLVMRHPKISREEMHPGFRLNQWACHSKKPSLAPRKVKKDLLVVLDVEHVSRGVVPRII